LLAAPSKLLVFNIGPSRLDRCLKPHFLLRKHAPPDHLGRGLHDRSIVSDEIARSSKSRSKRLLARRLATEFPQPREQARLMHRVGWTPASIVCAAIFFKERAVCASRANRDERVVAAPTRLPDAAPDASQPAQKTHSRSIVRRERGATRLRNRASAFNIQQTALSLGRWDGTTGNDNDPMPLTCMVLLSLSLFLKWPVPNNPIYYGRVWPSAGIWYRRSAAAVVTPSCLVM